MPQPFVVTPRTPAPRRPRPGTLVGAPDAEVHPLQDVTVMHPAPSSLSAAARYTPTRRPAQTAAPGPDEVPPPPSRRLAGRVVPRHPVLEPLAAFLDDPEVTDIFINGPAGLFVDRGAGAVAVPQWRSVEADVRTLAIALIGLGGRHIDDATPCVDVRLDGGIRIHAVLPPIAAEGSLVSIRVPAFEHPDLDELQRRRMFGVEMRARLDALVANRVNILVTGAAGSGKTTLLAALLARTPATERIVTIEDVAELRIDHPHHVRLEARQPNLEGAGGIGLPRLVREALRMRPDRLVVGECRGEEVRELLSALNTGHDGGAGTVHANGLDDVPARLEALGALAGLDDRALARQVASAIGCVVHLERTTDGTRRIAGMGRPVIIADRLGMEAESCPP